MQQYIYIYIYIYTYLCCVHIYTYIVCVPKFIWIVVLNYNIHVCTKINCIMANITFPVLYFVCLLGRLIITGVRTVLLKDKNTDKLIYEALITDTFEGQEEDRLCITLSER